MALLAGVLVGRLSAPVVGEDPWRDRYADLLDTARGISNEINRADPPPPGTVPEARALCDDMPESCPPPALGNPRREALLRELETFDWPEEALTPPQ